MLHVKWVCDPGCMGSCGVVRGVIPSMQLNNTRKIHIDVKTTRELIMSDFPGTDIMVLQRTTHNGAVDIATRARLDRIRIVFDIDDSLWLLPDKNDELFTKFGTYFPEDHKATAIELMKNHVDIVTCSTPELEASIKELGVLRTRIIANGVDPQFFVSEQPRSADKPTIDIVWYAASGHQVNSGMLESIFNVIFQEFPNVRLHLIGAAPSFTPLKDIIMSSGNKIVLHNWIQYTELGKFLHTCDIALCPVMDFSFTRCKSELKAIESSMAGLVPVMSDMPQYRRFSDSVLTEREKCLVVPNDVDAWIDIIRRLVKRELVIDTEDLMSRAVSKYSIAKTMMEWGNFYHNLV